MKSEVKSEKRKHNGKKNEKKDKSKYYKSAKQKNSNPKKNPKSSGNIKIKVGNNRKRDGKEKGLNEEGGKDMQERRREERIPVEVEVRYFSQEGFAIEWITNISKGGLFIKSENPLPPGTPLKITFSVPGKDVPIELGGVVRWSVSPSSSPSVIPGMGIQITEIDDKSRKILDAFVDEILSSRRI